MNFLKTTVLLATLTGLLVALGYYFGGVEMAYVGFAVGALLNFVSYWFSDKIVLRMYHARQVTQYESPQLYGIVEKLARKAQLPMPKVYIIPTDTPNAFATGRNPSHASVAATEGIMRLLGAEELEGVMAHELAHVKHRDILTCTIAATLGGAISMLARVFMYGGSGRDRNKSGGGIIALAVMILAPLAAMLIQMAISRSREYAADAAGARICGKPTALASALNRLEMGVQNAPMEMGDPATSSLFIVNPFKVGFMARLFSTHPPMEERIRRLRGMRGER
ncbi:MAG: zinc metalloprotease HtpX [Chitinispirillales bacterium]|jgi:heat shock protein HtpX|nr:zinc metalloprotease HtpX [Chitinispirillales bacterium]